MTRAPCAGLLPTVLALAWRRRPAPGRRRGHALPGCLCRRAALGEYDSTSGRTGAQLSARNPPGTAAWRAGGARCSAKGLPAALAGRLVRFQALLGSPGRADAARRRFRSRRVGEGARGAHCYGAGRPEPAGAAGVECGSVRAPRTRRLLCLSGARSRHDERPLLMKGAALRALRVRGEHGHLWLRSVPLTCASRRRLPGGVPVRRPARSLRGLPG